MTTQNRVCGRRWLLSACTVLVLVVPAAARAQGAACTPTPLAIRFPAIPVQFMGTFDPNVPGPGDSPLTPKETERLRTLYVVQPDRYLLIQSIAVKGTHPAKSYLALELVTDAPAVVIDNRGAVNYVPLRARHFLYARDASEYPAAVHVRDTLHATAMWGTQVQFGAQWTAGSKPEKFAITVTGTLVDVCKWGQIMP
jgi:hypothetical protein